MPVYKDEQRGTWYAMFYATDWKGEKHKYKKRGFKKSEAQEYEREFLSKGQQSCDMLFTSFVDMYLEYSGKRNKDSTFHNKKSHIEDKILPYFGEKPLNQIRATDIHAWQNEMIEQEFRPTYLRSLHSTLSAIFNYAVNYYDLPKNPCKQAGTIGSKKAETIDFWTLKEFNRFISTHCGQAPGAGWYRNAVLGGAQGRGVAGPHTSRSDKDQRRIRAAH